MEHEITLVVNGATRRVNVPARRLLSDCLRHDLGLTGTHVGCEHGVCGCCTVLLDGRPVRSCLTFAVTVDGQEITTVEGLAREGAPPRGLRSAGSAATGATGEGGGTERPSRPHDVEEVKPALSPVQRAFAECHGLQCGFCTPGFLCTVTAFLRDNPAPSDDEIVEGISGNLCRCTGYQNIVKAVHRAAELLAEET
ncbi:(2Fe-2S)-binding protein [Nonomuraea deserti]|uniref:(2Fe-2S)-binding protein n=1 Tax=Nonomuraea deserti TaxID=1848322 RepID=A0A4R4VPV7_9ACTN|nr:(2Fe-2S)-binding protein [Nonomuraea deserti]TDD07919.1 (2Fe-2S)-binding protein [Nonomuraea deserti]